MRRSLARSLISLLFFVPLIARGDFREFRALPVEAELGARLARVAEVSFKEFPKLTPDNLALSVVDLTKPEHIIRADYHGDAPFYPASLVKLFFMVEAFHQGHLTPEIERALAEMIHVSDNDAAAFLVDVLTDTGSGSELNGKALEDFLERRRKLNRYFASLGYDVSVFIKPWSFGPFGRDMQIMGENKINRNRASANSIASLLLWTVRQRAISPEASKSMLALLERPLDPPRPGENQVKDFMENRSPPAHAFGRKKGTPAKSGTTPPTLSCPAAAN